MTVGNLTYAIVIRTELHGEDYQFTGGGRKTAGGQMLRVGGKSANSTPFECFLPFQKNTGETFGLRLLRRITGGGR